MTIKTGYHIINEASKLDTKWFSFTGGEPFLELELLQKLIKLATAKGVKTEVVTNGNWASSPLEAEKTLKLLKESGLNVLNLSIDDYHSEFIPNKHVKNAYYAALNQELKPIIMTTRQKNSNLTSDSIKELLNDTNIQVLGKTQLQKPNALLIETPITPAGRGKSIKKLDKKQIPKVTCKEPLRDIGIDPYGEIYPCCGPLATKYSIGNVKKTNLEYILNDTWKDPLFTSIHKGTPAIGEYSSKCHACLSLFNPNL
jgi:radical SAM protein with 4Fe4S-binding SPASM domain